MRFRLVLLVSAIAMTAVSSTVAAVHRPRATPHAGTAIGAGDIGAEVACGTERWAVKTLSDADASKVNYTPKSTTVDSLRKFAKPSNLGQNTPRLAGTEFTTYKVTANLVEAKREDDLDIHLVIADPHDSKTMIVEFPDTTCDGANVSIKKDAMKSARDAFVAACGTPPSSSFVNLKGKATLTGVGFFDILHGQTGVAPNGIELHAVLSFSTTSCTRT